MSSKESTAHFPSHNSQTNTGHMGELATRLTRMGTDAVWTKHVPHLARKLLKGSLEVQDILRTRSEYFGEKPAIATMFQSRGKFGNGNSIYPSGFFASNTGTVSDEVGGIKIRTINVEADNSFTHPEYHHLPALGEKIVYQMNKFVRMAPRLEDADTRQILHKFYLIFSALHLPADGSGRLNGDTNTLLQRGLKLSLNMKGREFVPQLISHTGYRIKGAEAWAMNEQTVYRSFLISEVMKMMNKRNPLLILFGITSRAQGNQNINQADKMLEQYKPALDGMFALKPYYSAVSHSLSRQIDTIFDTKSATWINALSKNAMRRQKHAHTSPIYFTSKELNMKYVPVLDTLTSQMHYDNFLQVATILGSPELISHGLLRSPIRQRVVEEAYKQLKKHNRELALRVSLENRYLRK